MRQFVESEIVLPDGPYRGLKFRCDRQPYSGLLFDAIDSGMFSRHVITGPVQSGKTLVGTVAPVLYHLFEVQETVIFGLPDMAMAVDKWQVDLLPVIEKTRYRELLPTSGLGSKGGKVMLIRLLNGQALRFMSAGGGDKQRAGFTSRVVVITETDGMQTRGGKSDEADKITQFEGRTQAFGNQARIYMECTLTTKLGRTWQEYEAGSASKIACCCPHCQSFVTLEREHLVGWQAAATEAEAEAGARFACVACGSLWSDDDRRIANQRAVLLHRGQTAPETHGGPVGGQPQATRTLGFRWSAVNNLFKTTADLGVQEWKASRAIDQDNAEREACQYRWAIPYQPPVVDMAGVTHESIMQRTTMDLRGRIPAGIELLTLGIDVGKWLCHWTLTGWRKDGTGHIVDYGRLEVASNDMAPEKAILNALRAFREQIESGWLADNGQLQQPCLVMIDSGYQTKTAVYPFTLESGRRYAPSKGHGIGQQDSRAYYAPKSTGTAVTWVGDHSHLALLPASDGLPPMHLAEFDADYWKAWVHDRLSTPTSQAGSLTLFKAGQPMEHLSFARHLTAEKLQEEFHPTKGRVLKWHVTNKNNHWLDATAMAALAGHIMGVRITQAVIERTSASSSSPALVVSSPWDNHRR